MNEVRVSSPYLPESVTGGTPAANERVRKVVRSFGICQNVDSWNAFLWLDYATFTSLIHVFFHSGRVREEEIAISLWWSMKNVARISLR